MRHGTSSSPAGVQVWLYETRACREPAARHGEAVQGTCLRPAIALYPWAIRVRIDRASSIMSATIRAAGLMSRMCWTPSPAGIPMASKLPVVSGVGGRALKVGMGTPGVANEVPGNSTRGADRSARGGQGADLVLPADGGVHGRVAQHAVGLAGDLRPEEGGDHRVLAPGLGEAALPLRMGVGLGGGDEPRPHPDAVRPVGQRGHHVGSGGDAAGGQHQHVVPQLLADLAEQVVERRRAPVVPARLLALDHQPVRAGGERGPRLLERGDLHPDGDARGLERRHPGGGGDAEVEDGQVDLGRGRDLDVAVDGDRPQRRRGGEEEVHAERPAGEGADLREALGEHRRRLRRHPEHSQAAGLRDRRHQLRQGHESHAGAHERVPQAEALGQPRPQLRPLRPAALLARRARPRPQGQRRPSSSHGLQQAATRHRFRALRGLPGIHPRLSFPLPRRAGPRQERSIQDKPSSR